MVTSYLQGGLGNQIFQIAAAYAHSNKNFDTAVFDLNNSYTTHAYGINSKIFDKILNEAIYHPIIDVFYCRYIVPLGDSLIMNPMVAIQQEGFSNIENHHADYNWMIDFFNKIKIKSKIN